MCFLCECFSSICLFSSALLHIYNGDSFFYLFSLILTSDNNFILSKNSFDFVCLCVVLMDGFLSFNFIIAIQHLFSEQVRVKERREIFFLIDQFALDAYMCKIITGTFFLTLKYRGKNITIFNQQRASHF